MNKNTVTTRVIVIRKNLFKESSLIVTGFAPELGKINMIFKGATKNKSNKLPVIDLFRELELDINPDLHNLQSIYNASLLNTYDSIANYYENFTIACKICSFLFFNIHPEVSSPLVYKATLKAFNSLTTGQTIVPWLSLVKLIYLRENGFLPEIPKDDTGRKKLFDDIISAILTEHTMPLLDLSYWKELSKWIDSISNYHNLRTQ
jgi:DNA repair protein RecO